MENKLFNQFASYDISENLKVIGFDEICFYSFCPFNMMYPLSSDNYTFYDRCHPDFLPAPTYQQVIDWFREKHKLHIEVNYLDNVLPYSSKVTDIQTNTEVFISKYKEDYYLVLSEAIEYCICEYNI